MRHRKKFTSAMIGGFVCLVVLAYLALASRGSSRALSEGVGCLTVPKGNIGRASNAYDRQVLRLHPVMYLTLGDPSHGSYHDLSGEGNDGVYMPHPRPLGTVRLPNGGRAGQFDGQGQYVQIRSRRAFSVTDTGCLTIEAWIRPSTLQFPHEEGSGYVYILGKGQPYQQEYALRMYSFRNSEVPERPNRISAYAWNPAGGEGSGSYFQDRVRPFNWIMVTFVIDDRPSRAFPHGVISIYKDGRLRGSVSLYQFHVIPRAGDAPFRIGTRNLNSFFWGGIGNVAVYDYVLSGTQIAQTYESMFVSHE